MVTQAVMKGAVNAYGQGTFWDIRGKSTDNKPVDGVPNGSTFIEINTGKGFLFDGDSKVWHELPSGGAVVIPTASGVSF